MSNDSLLKAPTIFTATFWGSIFLLHPVNFGNSEKNKITCEKNSNSSPEQFDIGTLTQMTKVTNKSFLF